MTCQNPTMILNFPTRCNSYCTRTSLLLTTHSDSRSVYLELSRDIILFTLSSLQRKEAFQLWLLVQPCQARPWRREIPVMRFSLLQAWILLSHDSWPTCSWSASKSRSRSALALSSLGRANNARGWSSTSRQDCTQIIRVKYVGNRVRGLSYQPQ